MGRIRTGRAAKRARGRDLAAVITGAAAARRRWQPGMRLGMRERCLGLAVAAVLGARADVADAAPFVLVTLEGRRTGSGAPFASTVGVDATESVDYRVRFIMAPIGTTNVNPAGTANDAINSYNPSTPASTSNGLNNIRVSVFESLAQQIQIDCIAPTLAGSFAAPPGASTGTVTPRGNGNDDVIGVWPVATAGNFLGIASANTPATTDLFSGTFTVSSMGSGASSLAQVGILGVSGTFFGMKYNNTVTYSGTSTQQAGVDPPVGFTPLKLLPHGTWMGGSGKWTDAINWSDGAAPSGGAGVHVRIDNGNPTPSTLSLNQNATVGDVRLDADDTLIVGPARTLELSGPATSVLRGWLTVSGRVDIGSGRMVLAASTAGGVGTWTGSAYTGVTGLIKSGRNGGGWGGSGIVTSQSSATSGDFTSIGIASAAQAKGITASQTSTWDGQAVTGSDTLIMYTYGGDANLDGTINVLDYGQIDLNVPRGRSGWFNGDFNYDGKIDVLDYGIIDFNIGIQGPAFSTAERASDTRAAGAVPEPGVTALAISLAAIHLPRCRRRRS